jgi:hypothetical protein
MKRHAMTVVAAVLMTAFLAAATFAQEAKPGPAAPAATKQVAPAPSPATAPTAAPTLPRQARWARVDITYRPADVRHPALYCDSVQEKLRHEDAAHRGPLGLAFAWAYECIQFPAQLIATPVLVVIKPPWTLETGRP